MKGSVVLVAVIILAGIAVSALLLKPATPMPVYKGHTADEWLSQYFHNEPNNAFNEMGTNALPYLVNQFRIRDSVLAKAWYVIEPKLPGFVRSRLPEHFYAEQRWSAAGIVLDEQDAESVLPELLKLLAERNNGTHDYILSVLLPYAVPKRTNWVPVLSRFMQEDQGTRWRAARMLGQIGPNAKAALTVLNTAMLHETNDETRFEEVSALWSIGRETNGVVYIQKLFLTNTVPSLQRWSAIILFEIGWTDPAIIPALAKLAPYPEEELSIATASLLKKFGPAAKSAVPALVQAYEANPPDKRACILDALNAIDPQAAKQCVLKHHDDAIKKAVMPVDELVGQAPPDISIR